MSLAKKNGGVCRHCRTAWASRPLGLCWQCYYAPGVRAMYAKPRQPQHLNRSVIEAQVPVVVKVEAGPGEPACPCGRPLKSYQGLCEDCRADFWAKHQGGAGGHTLISTTFVDVRERKGKLP